MENDQITTGTPIKKPVPISVAPFGGLDDDEPSFSGNSGASASSTPSPRGPIKLSRDNVDKNIKAGDDLAKQLELPKKPGEVVQDVEVIQKWFDLLSPEHWNKLMVYVNRIYPVINRKIKNPDENKYIDVISKDTYESAGNKSIYRYLSNQHGGGKYQLYVNDVSKKGNQTLFIGYVIIPTDEVEPKINLDELDVFHKSNAGFIVGLQNKGIMDSNKKFVDKSGGTTQTGTTTQGSNGGSDTAAVMAQMGAMYKDMFGMMAKLSEKDKSELNKGGMNEIFLEKLKQEDPNKQFAMLTTMLTALRELMPKPVVPDTSNQLSMKDVLQMQQNSNDKMMELMLKVMDGNKNEKDSEGELEKLARYKQILPELFGGRGRSGEDREKTTGELIYDGVKELGLPILGIISQVFQGKTGIAPIIPVTIGQAQAMIPGPAASNVIPMPAPQQTQNNNPQQGQSNNPPQQEQVMPENVSPIVVKYIQAYGLVIVNAIKAKQTGIDVGQAISDMTLMLGEDVYTILKTQGKDKILSTMKAIPEFWNQTGGVYGEAHMVQFVEEFINFEEILDKEDGEERGNDDPVA